MSGRVIEAVERFDGRRIPRDDIQLFSEAYVACWQLSEFDGNTLFTPAMFLLGNFLTYGLKVDAKALNDGVDVYRYDSERAALVIGVARSRLFEIDASDGKEIYCYAYPAAVLLDHIDLDDL